MAGLDERKQEREINGVTYEAWPLGFAIGRGVLTRTIKVVAPIIAGAARGRSGAEQAAGAFEALPAALTEADLAYFGKVFGNASKFKNAETGNMVPLIEENQDRHFAARYDAFIAWILFCMEVNGFPAFFRGETLKGAVADLLAKMPKGST